MTYKKIKSLLIKEEQRERVMYCVFKCSISDLTVDSHATIRKERERAGNRVADRVKQTTQRSLMYSVRRALSRVVGGLLGSGIAGRIGREAVRTAMSEAQRSIHRGGSYKFSKEEKRAAVEEAFRKVANRFLWDSRHNRWISAQLGEDVTTDFVRQMESSPILWKYDQGVMARMLAEITNADGIISQEEKEFLSGFFPSEVGTVDELSEKPILSRVELEETAKNESRETMLMVAWALALTDDLDVEEENRLAEYEQGLEIPGKRANEVKKFARDFIIDRAIDHFYSKGAWTADSKQQVLELAEKIGVVSDEAERIEIKYRKRSGLV